MGVRPQAAFRRPRFGFGGGVVGGLVVVFVVPGVARLEHFEIDVASIDEHLADGASVAVGVANLDDYVFAEDERGKILLGLLTERLGFLRRVDAVKPDFVLGGAVGAGRRPCHASVRRVGGNAPYRRKDRDRVAVGDFHHASANLRAHRLWKRARARAEALYGVFTALRGGVPVSRTAAPRASQAAFASMRRHAAPMPAQARAIRAIPFPMP